MGGEPRARNDEVGGRLPATAHPWTAENESEAYMPPIVYP